MTRTLLLALLLTGLVQPAAAACPEDRVSRLEAAAQEAVIEINRVIYRMNTRENGQPVDEALVDQLSAAVDALDEAVSNDGARALICTGRADVIADDDPALELFREAEPDSLKERKVALAIERVNSCD